MRPPYRWQQEIWQQLRSRQQRGELMQAILLTGQPGVGKSALATELARSGLCHEAAEQGCGSCQSCRLVDAGAHPDLLEVRVLPDKREILIDQIRDFSAAIQLTASQSHGRYGVIHGADRLNPAAANALLKTLEEPPRGTSLLLTADQLVRIPATIRSRCTRIAVPTPDAEQARAWLQERGLDPTPWRRRVGPCALAGDREDGQPTAEQEARWAELVNKLQRDGDSPAAAQSVGEDQFASFIGWWQAHLLEELKQARAPMSQRRLWDAMITVRRQSHLNFNRLLALEGLFILYLQLASPDGPRA